jgi:hypothetical protein
MKYLHIFCASFCSPGSGSVFPVLIRIQPQKSMRIHVNIWGSLMICSVYWHGPGLIVSEPNFAWFFFLIYSLFSSVADPGCLSRIPDPDFYPSRISDPGSNNSNKREGLKQICCHTFLCSHKSHKIKHYSSFEVLKKKIWANFQRIIELFIKKTVTKLSKIWVWDLGSGKNRFRNPDPGSRGQKGTGSRIRIRNTAFFIFLAL